MQRRHLLQTLAAWPLATLAGPGAHTAQDTAALHFPQDFGAHPQQQTEWWYITGYLGQIDAAKPGLGATSATSTISTMNQPEYGFQLTFFRSATRHDAANPSRFAPTQLILAHAAISDIRQQRFYPAQKRARAGFDLAWAKTGNTDLKLDTWHLQRQLDGQYQASIGCADFALTLQLAPTQPLLPQGEQGMSRKGPLPQQFSHYYSEVQLAVNASLRLPASQAKRPMQGRAWLDHEWAARFVPPEATGWDWLGINLFDGSALMAFQMRKKDGSVFWSEALLRLPNGEIQHFPSNQVQFTSMAHWQSAKTGTRYPVRQQLQLRQGEQTRRWQIEALLQDQELDARASTGNVYWEGLVSLMQDGKAVGYGYLEMTGYDRPLKL